MTASLCSTANMASTDPFGLTFGVKSYVKARVSELLLRFASLRTFDANDRGTAVPIWLLPVSW